jgi:hypothetical protein
MKKLMRAAAVMAALMFSMASALAATTVTLTEGPPGQYTGGWNVTHSGDFTDTYHFLPELPWIEVSTVLSTIGFTATEDINFSSVTLNGHLLTLASDGPVDYAYTAGPLVLSGPLTLVVVGTSGSNASYSGTFNMSVVPEPDTIALLVAGLGLVGLVTRRRQKGLMPA